MGEKREARDGSLRDTTIFTVLSVQARKSEGDEVLIPFICYQTVLVLIGPILFLSWAHHVMEEMKPTASFFQQTIPNPN